MWQEALGASCALPKHLYLVVNSGVDEHWRDAFEPLLVGKDVLVITSKRQGREAIADYLALRQRMLAATVGYFVCNHYSTAGQAASVAATEQAMLGGR